MRCLFVWTHRFTKINTAEFLSWGIHDAGRDTETHVIESTM